MATEPQQAAPSRDHRDEQDRYQLDRRITILETRFDTMLPMLATKADLAELKAELLAKLGETTSELKADMGRLSRWMATMAVTMVLGFAGMFITLLSLLRY
jgi:hypothetical protein